MSPKHLIAVDRTQDKKSDFIDDTPFTTVRLSPETRKAMEEETHRYSKNLIKSLKLPQTVAGYLLLAVGVVILFSLIRRAMDVGLSAILRESWWLGGLGLLAAAIGGGLLIYCRAAVKKKEDEEDNPNASDEAMDNISRRVELELGIPAEDELTRLDVLTYHYVTNADGSTEEIFEEGCFENDELYLWREGDSICLTDYECVLKIPRSAFTDCRKVAEDYKISFWWKDIDHNKGDYARYKIREDKDFNYRLNTYYIISVSGDWESFELRIPCYDLPIFQDLVGLPCLDDMTEL